MADDEYEAMQTDWQLEDERDAREQISQENSWQVISSYFESKGLVRQQLVRCPPGAAPAR